MKDYRESVSFILLNLLFQVTLGAVLSPLLDNFAGPIIVASSCETESLEGTKGWFESYGDSLFIWFFYLFVNFIALLNLVITAVFCKFFLKLNFVASHLLCCTLVVFLDYLIIYLNAQC